MQLDKEVQFATREQELLLQAAILEGEDAISAWQQWKSIVDLEGHHDNGSYRLLPLLYKNLQRYGVEEPFMERLKGIYRLEWYKNQRLFYEMNKVLKYLHDAGIQTMILKGAALTVLIYKNYSVRPMADIDILVPISQISLTINLLKDAGWTPTTDSIDGNLRYQHSMQFRDQFGKELDLHWHPFFESCGNNSDRDFWERSVSIQLADVSTLALNPTDTLLHVVVHGAMWNPEPPIRWIADAMSLINSSDKEIEWTRFINQAEKHKVVLRVKEALHYLQDKFQACIPMSIMDKINQIPISFTERLEYRYPRETPDTISNTFVGKLLGGFPRYLVIYLRLTNSTGLLRKITGLPRYLQYRLHAKSLHALFFYLISRNIRITKNKLSSRLRANNSR